MPTTPRGYPDPDFSDSPNGPVQISALANAVDADVTEVVAQNLADRAFRRVTRDPATTLTATAAGVGVAAWGSGNYDNGGGITVGTGGDSGKLIAPASQVGTKGYVAYATVQFPAGTGQVRVWFNVNGTDFAAGSDSRQMTGAHQTPLSTSGPLVLAAGDKVQVFVASLDGNVDCSPIDFALECKG
jgi:hypothetical protein